MHLTALSRAEVSSDDVKFDCCKIVPFGLARSGQKARLDPAPYRHCGDRKQLARAATNASFDALRNGLIAFFRIMEYKIGVMGIDAQGKGKAKMRKQPESESP